MVRLTILQGRQKGAAAIERELKKSVPDTGRALLRGMIEDEIAHLHEGVLARYGLRPSEFAAWQARQTQA